MDEKQFFNKNRILRAFSVVALFATLVSLQITLLDYPPQLSYFPTNISMLTGFAMLFWTFFTPQREAKNYNKITGYIILITAVLSTPSYITGELFRTTDLASMIISVQENSASNLAKIGISDFSYDFSEAIFMIVVFAVSAYAITRRVNYMWPVIILFCAQLLFFGPFAKFVYQSFFPNPYHQLIEPEEAIASPEIIERPNVRKNLVIVYLESLERTYRDIGLSSSAFSRLAEHEDESISFRNIVQYPGMDFTAGGLVATQCGVPLMSRGIFNIRIVGRQTVDSGGNTDFMLDEAGFLGNVDCLGDVLTKDGYVASYMNGSSLKIFGKGELFRSHGFTRLAGLEEMQGELNDPSRLSIWGLPDDFIFQKAKDEITALASQDQPFLFSMLTLRTHGPEAFLDEECIEKTKDVDPDQVLAAIRCTGDDLDELKAHIESLGIADDTILVVLSDHLAMRNTIYDHLEARDESRRNYATIINGEDQTIIDREGSPMDMYPTILDAMGYELEGDRANLGRSLLSETPTLTEELGRENFEKALTQNSTLQKVLWRNPE